MADLATFDFGGSLATKPSNPEASTMAAMAQDGALFATPDILKLKRPALVKLAHATFGSAIDPMHTSNDLIRQSLTTGNWVGATVGKVEIKPVSVETIKAPIAEKVKPEPKLPKQVALTTSVATAVADAPNLNTYMVGMDRFKAYHQRKLNGHTDVDTIVTALTNKQHVQLVGDAGTGKNHLGEAVAAKMQRPLLTVSFADKVEMDDFIGRYTYVHGVGTVWVDGIATLAAKYGAILFLDEINFCPPSITSVLHSLLDHRRYLTLQLKGSERINAHENFACISAMNPNYRGTRPLNEAFKDRFDLPLTLEYDNVIEAKLVKDKRLIKLATQLREGFRNGELTSPCSTRALMAYETNVKLHGPSIAVDAFVSRYDISEQPVVKQAIELHLQAPKSAKDIL